MGEVVHTSRIKIVREKGPTRRAMIEGFLFLPVHHNPALYQYMHDLNW